MKGSIRFFAGLLITMAAVGGIENATDAQLPLTLLVAVIGLYSMYSGTKAMKTV